jgi:hypothetical protein
LRNTTEVLRRGLDSTLANWQLIALRIAENFLFVLIIIASILAAIVPIAVAAGLSHFDLRNADNAAQAIAAIVVEHWALILYILVIITVVLGLLIAIHSFVEAGNARVFVDAERGAGRGAAQRTAFRAFTIDRWLQGGRSSWWSVFWIYNVAWGIAGLIMLIPLLTTLAGMLAINEPGGRVAIGCAGLVFTFLVVIPLALFVTVWTQKAIVVCVARAAMASAALRLGWAEIRNDFARHFSVAFLVFVIAFGGAMTISMLTAPLSFVRGVSHGDPVVNLAFAPMQILSSVLQGVFSAAVGLWFLASYVGLTEERR